MKRLTRTVFPPIALLLFSGFFWKSPTWESVNNIIDTTYPEVSNIDIDTLKEKMERESSILLIDARATKEYSVSHLPGAIHLENPANLKRQKDTEIVVYCSVGIRSAAFSKKLQQQGYTNVSNLRGSIFLWANRGYPLVRGNISVSVVHPYNKKWGQLLEKKYHSDEPVINPDSHSSSGKKKR